MAELVTESEANSLETIPASSLDRAANPLPWRQAPIVRQVAVLIALAGAIAVGVAVALWSKDPIYTPVFPELSHADAGKVAEALKQSEVPFRIDEATGGILVPSSRIRDVRMRLAAQGLPESGAVGLELLQEEQDLSTSQFIESARYNHALETELARSISTLKNVKTARVHLAIPKQSIFVRKRTNPTASVVVSLHPGRVLDQSQVDSIVHLVSSSIANMSAEQVTVVDQHGRLLTDARGDKNLAMSGKQFTYRRELERDYSERIVQLLEPIVGYGKVRAQVTAELNFTKTESTEETFDPRNRDPRTLVRSEQTNEEENQLDRAIGVPGALSNQPPGAGTTDEESAEPNDASSTNRSNSATRNYEIDRVISHTRHAEGEIRRLSVAVVIDDKTITIETPVAQEIENLTTISEASSESEVTEGDDSNAEQGESAESGAPQVRNVSTSRREPYSDEEVMRLTALVREVIGFDESRGDTINVMNSSFFQPEVGEIPEIPLWEQIWIQDLIKQVLSGIFILLLLLLIVRPIIRGLIPPAQNDEEVEVAEHDDDEDEEVDDDEALEGEVTDPEIVWGEDGRPIDPAADAGKMQYDKKINYARILVLEDPARAATVMKVWMNATEDERDAA